MSAPAAVKRQQVLAWWQHPPARTRTERAAQLRDAILEVASRMADADRDTVWAAFEGDRDKQHRAHRARMRRYVVLLRLTAALRDLPAAVAR